VSLDLLVSLLWYWGRSNGSDVWSLPDVVPSDFDEECMAEALPAIRRLIADDALRAWLDLDNIAESWATFQRLTTLWQAAEEAQT